jgi:2-keto-3-deoxy-L-rhamnonate aldolase RhmA
MRENLVRAKLKRGEPVYGTMMTEFNHTGIPLLLADAGFDFFFLDMEHGTYDLPMAANIIRVARLANIAPIVRVPDGMYHLIATVLDAGAMGIMIPRVKSRDVVERSVAAMRYPPQGERGMFHGKGNSDFQTPPVWDYAKFANENLLCVVQIENREAVEHVDSLLSVPGVDAALIGPFDLAMSLGIMPNDATSQSVMEKVIDAAKRHNVACGIHLGDPASVKAWQARGMQMLSCSTDIEMLRASFRNVASALRA